MQITSYQMFKMKQQQKTEMANIEKDNRKKHHKAISYFTNNKHHNNDNKIWLKKDQGIKIENKVITNKDSTNNDNNIDNNKNDNEMQNEVNNNLSNSNNNSKQEETHPMAAYDEFCIHDENNKIKENEDDRDQSIQENANKNQQRKSKDNTAINIDHDNSESNSPKANKCALIRKKSRDNSKRLPTISLKNRMMLKMKSIAIKRETKKILVPISTLLDFSAKAASGSQDIVIKDFYGKIYSSKVSQSSFVFSNTHHGFFIEQNIFELDNFFIFGVFECEGKEGYQIATIAKMNFIYFFSSEFLYNKRKRPTEEEIYSKISENKYYLIRKAFEKIINDINLTRYDSKQSGVSLSLALVIGTKLVCASVGITKPIAILHKEENGFEYLNSFEFSSFHSLCTENERQRIEKVTKGQVTYNEEDSLYQLEIGLDTLINMKVTRSLGMKDHIKYGLTSEPEINELTIDNACKCLFIANKTLYDTLGSTFLMKMLSIGMTQKEAIAITCDKILNSYQKRLQSQFQPQTHSNPKSNIKDDNDCVYLIVYFNNITKQRMKQSPNV